MTPEQTKDARHPLLQRAVEGSYYHAGIANDARHQATIPPEERCSRCEGTGNQMLAMYQRCIDCGGSGLKKDVTEVHDD